MATLSRTCFTGSELPSPNSIRALLAHVACLQGGPKYCRLVSKLKTKMKKDWVTWARPAKMEKTNHQSPAEQASFFGSILSLLLLFNHYWNYYYREWKPSSVPFMLTCRGSSFGYLVLPCDWQGSVTGPFLRVLLHWLRSGRAQRNEFRLLHCFTAYALIVKIKQGICKLEGWHADISCG